MIGRVAFRQSMASWNIFLAAGIFVAGLFQKIGAPTYGVVLGLGFAGIVNGVSRGARSPDR